MLSQNSLPHDSNGNQPSNNLEAPKTICLLPLPKENPTSQQNLTEYKQTRHYSPEEKSADRAVYSLANPYISSLLSSPLSSARNRALVAASRTS